MTVSIQFCGGCNPRIDRGQVARELQEAMEAMDIEVVFNTLVADVVIFLSGCMSGCAFKFHPTTPPYITIAATTVDDEEVGPARIVPQTLRKLQQIPGRQGMKFREGRMEGRNAAEPT